MTNFTSVHEWLNIRPRELRPLFMATAAAFFLLSFMILTRSLRESLFLSTYPIEKLPLMMGTLVLLSFPGVGQFSRLVTAYPPKLILTRLTLVVTAGFLILWKLLPVAEWAIPVFYVWTAIGSLLMASGFWMVTAELFPLRGAKRLFSLISAGGTLGAMLTGVSLSWLTHHVELTWLVLFSLVLPLLFLVLVNLMPHSAQESRSPAHNRSGIPLVEASRLIWRTRHLRLMAGIIFTATLVMTLVDFQFKELVQIRFSSGADLTGFLGAFYGWAGFGALLLQVFLSGRLIEKRGVAFSLSVSSGLLIIGGAGILFSPSLAAATILRGTDYSLRKSLFRPTMEVLFVSVPTRFRRLTKTFIDSIVDSAAEGFGALIILLWISVLDLPSAGLSWLVVFFATVYFTLSRLVNRSYFQTISHRLKEEESRAKQLDDQGIHVTGNLLRATFTNLDLSELRNLDVDQEPGTPPPPPQEAHESAEMQILAGLNSPDTRVVLSTLSNIDTLDPDHIALLARLMARDELFHKVADLLQRFPEMSVPPLTALVEAEKTDFVIRRRIPEILAHIGGAEADDALLDLLTDPRFEVRYRAAVALLARRKHNLPTSAKDWPILVWHAISMEVRKDRPLWELHRLLDATEIEDDDLITIKVGVRGELSLEHTFRLLSLVLDPEQVRAAYHGVIFDDPELKSFALEYLELVLPRSVKERLWFYIGDVSEQRKKKQTRSLDNVVADMMVTGQTLFGGEITRQALDKMVADRSRAPRPGKDEK